VTITDRSEGGTVAQQDGVVEQVWRNLADVIDPCSRMNGTHLNLVELGMIESVAQATPHEVTVKLFLDDPMCIYMVDIHRQVRAAASAVDGVNNVEIDVVADRLWTSEHMHESTRDKIRQWE
jgi:metal-sulfur cluster biosynthetic enzyme